MNELQQAITTIRTELKDSEQYRDIVLENYAQCVIRAAQQVMPELRFEQAKEIGDRAAEMALEILMNKE